MSKSLVDKKTPCQSCPFRRDIDFILSTDKVTSILQALRGDLDFPCHHTTIATGQSSSHKKGCLGAAIFLEHVREGGLRANLSFRLREICNHEFSRDTLDMSAPVFLSEAAFIAARTEQ